MLENEQKKRRAIQLEQEIRDRKDELGWLLYEAREDMMARDGWDVRPHVESVKIDGKQVGSIKLRVMDGYITEQYGMEECFMEWAVAHGLAHYQLDECWEDNFIVYDGKVYCDIPGYVEDPDPDVPKVSEMLQWIPPVAGDAFVSITAVQKHNWHEATGEYHRDWASDYGSVQQ